MNDNKRFLMAFGLMETDEKLIRDRKNFGGRFVYWSNVRQEVANTIEGAILAYCIDNGIYKKYLLHRAYFPQKLSTNQLTGKAKENGLFPADEFEGAPAEVIQRMVEYEKLSKQLEDKFIWVGLMDVLRSSPWNNRYHKQRVEGPGLPLKIIGVVSSPELVGKLDSLVTRVFYRLGDINYSFSNVSDIQRCVVARVIY